MAFRLRLSEHDVWGYITYRGDVFLRALDIAKYLGLEQVQEFATQYGSFQLGAVSHNCPLRMRHWLMIELFDLLRLLHRMEWGDVLLGFFEHGRIKIRYRGPVPLLIQRNRGIKFRCWLRHYHARIVGQRPVGLRL